MPSGPPTRTGAPPDAPGAVLLGAQVRWTGRADGDLRPPAPGSPAGPVLDGLAGRPVSWVRQVHGRRVLVAGDEPVLGEEADALVTASSRAALAVLTADCAPVALASPEGVVGAVHAGWAGVLAGVVGAAVDAMRALGATRVEAALGPCIRAGCYEFGRADLDLLVAALGPSVEGVTAAGRPALDLPGAVKAALAGAGAALVLDTGACTACGAGRHFSYRARGDTQRQAMVVWREG
ncbi:MAG: polyphenol oxidase family protein [Actinomycetota bacterium]